ncbi:MAG: oligosaccharide flippase family protein, partial [Candidatus Helarchaeota archaeon]
MNQIISRALEIAGKKKAKQVGSLYSSMFLGILFGVGVSVVNTRLLGAQAYGDLKFLINLFTFVVTFLTLGMFVTGTRLVARSENEPIKHQLFGNLLLLATIISIILIIILFILSFFENQIFNNQLGRVIRLFSPFMFVFPFRLCLEGIMAGDNRIYELSAFRLLPKILYLVVAISFNYFIPLSLMSALAINFITSASLILVMIILFKPEFVNIKKNLSIIWKANKTHGLQVYIGVLAGIATSHLAGLSIGYFIDNKTVGFFYLAITITMPLTIIPNAVGTTFYKGFANINSIPKKVTFATFILSIGALLFFLLIIKKVILLLYSSEFEAVIPLAYLI